METAALTIRSTTSRSHCPAPAHGQPRRAACLPRRRGRRQPWSTRIQALPSAEVISEIFNPKLVPGSPADTGDVSSLIPVSALMLLFYFVSNWVVPELLMKRLNDKPEADDDKAAAAAAMSADGRPTDDGDAAEPRKIRLKVKKNKNRKPTIVKV